MRPVADVSASTPRDWYLTYRRHQKVVLVHAYALRCEKGEDGWAKAQLGMPMERPSMTTDHRQAGLRLAGILVTVTGRSRRWPGERVR